ncbi:MAG: alpha/beta hydrolase [Promethearchaeota archaeon]
MQKFTQNTLRGAGPFYFHGNNLGILMIPGGGGGTCADLKYIAEDVHDRIGCTISIPLLPGFGTSPKDLRYTQIEDWKNALDEELLLLKKTCNKIIAGGHSLGGVLALILVSTYDLDGVFTISAPIGVKSFLSKLVPFIRLFKKYYSIPAKKFREETNGKWIGYEKIPINQATKMNKLIREMKMILPIIKCPALLLQGRLDSVIKHNSMEYIFENIDSQVKRKVWLENNDHPILESPDHEIIVSEIINFINQI